MNPKPRYVFDTSAIVSAVLFEQSVPGKALYAGLDHGEILVSLATAAELREVLARKKFDRYLTVQDRERFLVKFLGMAKVIESLETVHVCRDPKDDKFLELAIVGQASCIISGDEDLLILHPFRGIPILDPAQFMEVVSKEGETEQD